MPTTDYWTNEFGVQIKAVRRTVDDFVNILDDLELDIRYNVRSLRIEIKHRKHKQTDGIKWYEDRAHYRDMIPPDGWVQITDLEIDELVTIVRENYVDVNTHHPIKLSAYAFQQFLNAAVSTRRVDPVAEWLTSLPPWDGVDRIHALFTDPDLLNAEVTEVATEAARRFMIGAVHRTLQPGCVHDWVPIIVGPQGSGKSSFVRSLVPADRPSWYEGNLNLADPTQKKIEAIGDAVIVEFSELRGAKSANIEGLKTFLSLPYESIRLSYRRNSEQILRRWVGIGTANNDGTGVLPYDPTGTRRFVTIEVNPKRKAADIRARLQDNLENIWAEALARYYAVRAEAGFSLLEARTSAHTLPSRIVDLSERINRRHITVDATEEDAAHQLTTSHARTRQANTITQLLVEARLAPDTTEASKDRATQRRLIRHLKNMGWVSKRSMIGGVTATRWYPPVDLVVKENIDNISLR